MDHNKLWNILKEMRIQAHLTCLLRNLYAGQEAIVRTGPGTMDWFQIGKVKGVSDSLQLHSPWNSPGQNTGVGNFSLLQGIFRTQGSNPALLHCGQILYQCSLQETLFRSRHTCRLKVRGLKKLFHVNRIQKKGRVAILRAHKTDFKTKTITTGKEHDMPIKG